MVSVISEPTPVLKPSAERRETIHTNPMPTFWYLARDARRLPTESRRTLQFPRFVVNLFDSALACYVTQRPHASTEDDSVVFWAVLSNSIGNEKSSAMKMEPTPTEIKRITAPS